MCHPIVFLFFLKIESASNWKRLWLIALSFRLWRWQWWRIKHTTFIQGNIFQTSSEPSKLSKWVKKSEPYQDHHYNSNNENKAKHANADESQRVFLPVYFACLKSTINQHIEWKREWQKNETTTHTLAGLFSTDDFITSD